MARVVGDWLAGRLAQKKPEVVMRDHLNEIAVYSAWCFAVVTFASSSLAKGLVSLVFAPFILWAILRLFGRLP
ncbi:MAG TPA: hypothetical protein VLP43_00005 [Solirubrobacteraceae bacterium]|nr:hypothetical protein [Solirubrobacteraceae bacterium]